MCPGGAKKYQKGLQKKKSSPSLFKCLEMLADPDSFQAHFCKLKVIKTAHMSLKRLLNWKIQKHHQNVRLFLQTIALLALEVTLLD